MIDVPSTPAEIIKKKESLKNGLVQMREVFEKVERSTLDEIAELDRYLAAAADGVTPNQLALARGLVYIRGDLPKGVEARARREQVARAARDLAEPHGGELRIRYHGTKNYAQWTDQDESHHYGYGPKHGTIVFEVGIRHAFREYRQDAPRTPLPEAERQAAIVVLEAVARGALDAEVLA